MFTLLKIKEQSPENQVNGQTLRKHCANPRIVKNAEELFKTEFKEYLEMAQNVSSIDALEAAYQKFKTAVLARWKNTKWGKSRRYKDIWNSTLDSPGGKNDAFTVQRYP